MEECGGRLDYQITQKMNYGGAGHLKRDEHAPLVQRIFKEKDSEEPAQFFIVFIKYATAMYDCFNRNLNRHVLSSYYQLYIVNKCLVFSIIRWNLILIMVTIDHITLTSSQY